MGRPRYSTLDPLGLLLVLDYIHTTLSAYGNVEERPFEGAGSSGKNLIFKLPGKHPEPEPVLVGAHYDGPPFSAAADDNATSLAALLELERLLSHSPASRPVWLVAFDQEELGLGGSRALAEQLKTSGQRLHLMLILEMLGYTAEVQRYPVEAMRAVYGTRGYFIAVVANTGAAALLPGLSRAMSTHVKTKVLPVPFKGRHLQGVRLSDHSPFWDADFKAAMVTDTSFMRNPHYHKDADITDTLDLSFLTAVTAGLNAAIRIL